MRKFLLAFSLVLLLTGGQLVSSQPASADAAPGGTTSGEVNIGFARALFPRNVRVGGLLGGLQVSRASAHGSFVTVKAPTLDVVRKAIALIPGVTYVEDNGEMRALVTPNDASFGSQYGPQMMHFPEAWSAVGYGSSSITAALIDSGILKTHEDLTGRVLQGHDYVNNDSDPNDDCGHGTHTAGILAATTNNGLGIAGGSQATILEMKGLGLTRSFFSSSCSGSIAGISQAIVDATDQGAKVISMSIGGGASSTLENAVNYAWNHGVILVAAAGNDGGSNSIDYPGAYTNVIAVGALDSNKVRASYSDGGPQLDIMAPGSNVLSSYTGSNSTYATLSGTSMATPGVAGAIALALGCETAGTTPTQVVNALYNTADDLGAVGYDQAYGHGLARADKLVAAVCGPSTPPVNQPPTAAFTTAASGTLGVTVNGSSSTDPDGDTLTYAWTFGDGATATGATPAVHTYASAGTYTIGLTVNDGHGHTASTTHSFTAAGAPVNQPPTAAFTATPSGVLGVAVNGSSSSDPDGDSLSYAWTFGDGGTATGPTPAVHTYASAGTYTIGLTVNDGHGHTATATTPFAASSDPDLSTPNVTSGQTTSIALSASNPDTYFKINVPAGKTQLRVALTGPSCGFFGFSCPVDGDLYTRQGARPTDTVYACRPFVKGNSETCTQANPAADYWYLRVKRAAGTGTVNLTATIS